MSQAGPRNHQWKGGRTVASNGYVLIKSPGHHLADVRGYVYEHRMVAEATLRRSLQPGEVVHHLNGVKSDNRPENLKVEPSRSHHALEHRGRADLRRPGEPNPMVPCACGCGATFARFDGDGRPRRYLPGHNSRVKRTAR